MQSRNCGEGLILSDNDITEGKSVKRPSLRNFVLNDRRPYGQFDENVEQKITPYLVMTRKFIDSEEGAHEAQESLHPK